MKLSIFSVILVSLLLSACASNSIKPPKPLPASSMKTHWKHDSYVRPKSLKRLRPYVTGTQVFIADSKGLLEALNIETGKPFWEQSFSPEFSFISGPVFEGGTLYVGTKQASLLACDQAGELKWEASLSSLPNAPVIAFDDLIYVRTQDGALTALKAETGAVAWRFAKENPALTLAAASKPVLSTFGLLLGSADGQLSCLNPQTGELLWESAIALPSGRSEIERMVDIVADPIVMEPVVFVATYRGKVAAIQLQNGDKLWERDLSIWEQLLDLPRHLIASTTQDEVLALDKRTGEIVWRQEGLHGRGLSHPVLVGDEIVVGDRLGQLHWLERERGTLMKTTQAWSYPIVQLEPTEKGLLITNDDGRLQMLEISL